MAYLRKLRTLLSPVERAERAARRAGLSDRFETLARRLQGNPFYDGRLSKSAPLGHFDGRSIIGMSTPILGGVYLGAAPHEAIVVDEKYGELHNLYTKLLVDYLKGKAPKDGVVVGEDIVESIFGLVSSELALSQERFRAVQRDEKLAEDEKVSLDLFVFHRVGLARHRVLLAAYLLEKLVEKGYLQGTWQIGREYDPHHPPEETLNFTSESGRTYFYSPREHGRQMGTSTLVQANLSLDSRSVGSGPAKQTGALAQSSGQR